MDLADQLAAERRSRLAAERRLEQVKRELYEANQKLAEHARTLTDEIVVKRREISRIRDESDELRSRYDQARTRLEWAKSAVNIAERRLWDSLETIRDGFAVFDPDNVLIAANRAFLSIFDGLDIVRPGIDMATCLALLTDEGLVDTGDLSRADWQAAMLERIAQPRIESAVLKMWNGQYYNLIERRTRGGDLVTLALNITEQTVREAQLSEARHRAEAASRAKSAFLANMSHEIRTPMNGVIAMAELLAETPLDDEQKACIETIRSSGEALLVIINDVLDYSKIEAEKVRFKAEPFDLERCIHDVVTLLQPVAEGKGLDLAVDYDLFLPTRFTGDAGRIRQVLTNLVGNAVKFTEAGHVTIRVVGLLVEGGHYELHMTVEDTGIGIPEDKLDAIFHEFQQVEDGRDRAHDGTGLGLAITQRLVGLMGGRIWVESTEGSGSGFGVEVVLPALDEPDAADLTAPAWIDRVLVLDNAGPNRQVLVRHLSLMGLRATAIPTWEALSAARPGPSDVVVVGPDLGGEAEEGARALREIFRPAGVLGISRGPGIRSGDGGVFDARLRRPMIRADLFAALGALAPEPADRPSAGDPDPGDRDRGAVAALPGPADAASGAPRPMRVLAAEDNKTNRFVFEKMLKGLELDLTFAVNGLEAVELYERVRPDIVFTDISMPKMDGKAATRRIREIEAREGWPPCPVVAITAHAMDGDAEEILAAGIDEYLAKPLKKQSLIDCILAARPDGVRPVITPSEVAAAMPPARQGSATAEVSRQAV